MRRKYQVSGLELLVLRIDPGFVRLIELLAISASQNKLLPSKA